MPSLLHTFTSTSRPSEQFEAAWCHMLWSQHLLCFETAAVLPPDNTDHFLGWLSLLLLILSSWTLFSSLNFVKLNFFIHGKKFLLWMKAKHGAIFELLSYSRKSDTIHANCLISKTKERQRLAANAQNISELTLPVHVYFLPFVFSTSLLNYLLTLILSLLMVIYNQY